MDYKVKNLYEKIYVDFIKGKFGNPKIPTKSEVIAKMEQITSQEYIPLTTYDPKKDIEIKYIQKTFSNIIDDIDILFGSIELESKDILDQLTESLKEHNGVKRELRRIKSTSEDIANGKIGEEYLSYDFTETFDNSKFINVLKSDPINYDMGLFTIRKDTDNILTLSHYAGTKLEFGIIENYAQVLDYGYVGTTDASVILDQQDIRQLVYKITTNKATRLRTAIVLQLTPDSREIDINSIMLDVDSDIAKGYVRIYYKSSYKWNDISGTSIQEIKSNKISFNFSDIKCSHIKIEFIKDSPDVFENNTYYYIINNIAISKATTKKTAILYSKSIDVSSYSDEIPIVSSISVSGDLDIPKDTDVQLFVAQDILISGSFVDSYGSSVDSDSPEAYIFNSSYSGFVFLSDIWKALDTISGVSVYKGLDFNWKPLKLYNDKKEKELEKIEFENTKRHDRIDNSLFSITESYLFGDPSYTGIYAVSGWINTDNPNWSILEPYVASGIYISGATVPDATWDIGGVNWLNVEDLSGNLNNAIISDSRYSGQWIGYNSGIGYPFNYFIEEKQKYLKFGEYSSTINGWWRPYSFTITSSGVDPNYSDGKFLSGNYEFLIPDFYFNNIPFYKIYKFGYNSTIIDPTIKLYTYQERPINETNDYYPCNFLWKYKSQWIDREGLKSDVVDPRVILGDIPSGWQDYKIVVPLDNLRQNEEYIVDSISEVKIHNTNFKLENYQTTIENGVVTSIDLSSMVLSHPWLKPEGTSFDYKYKYRVKNEYLSTWTAFIIVLSGEVTPNLKLSNSLVEGKNNVKLISKIDIEDLDTGVIKTYLDDSNVFDIKFSPTSKINGEGHYKITIYCASDNATGFCANKWVPIESSRDLGATIIVSPLIKIVQKLNPLKIVDISDLIYDTPMNNDNRAALIQTYDNEKFLIVKLPSKDSFPGNYYNSLEKKYYNDDRLMIENYGHWVRTQIESGNEITYTTGSSGEFVLEYDQVTPDVYWNNGSVLKDYPNTNISSFYQHHSTYGYPINIDMNNTYSYTLKEGLYDPRAPYESGLVGSTEWRDWLSGYFGWRGEIMYEGYTRTGLVTAVDTNRGFLFYPTAENLPSFYSISYRSVSSMIDINTRFLYKLQLTSNDTGSLVPKVKSLRFIINESV